MKKKIASTARILLGLIYFVFGLNGFFNFIPTPETMPPDVMAFFQGISTGGYFIPFLKATETICGLLLLLNTAAPLALVVLAPISLHIFLFHANLTPGLENLIMPVGILALHVFAATKYWGIYHLLFSEK